MTGDALELIGFVGEQVEGVGLVKQTLFEIVSILEPLPGAGNGAHEQDLIRGRGVVGPRDIVAQEVNGVERNRLGGRLLSGVHFQFPV